MGIPTVDELAEALHDVMCETSHHDRPPARCNNWPMYPMIARSAVRRLEERSRAIVEERRRNRPTCGTCGKQFSVAFDHAKDSGHWPPKT